MTALAEASRFRKTLPLRFGSNFKMSPTLRLLFPMSVRAIVCFARLLTLSFFQEAVCDFSHKKRPVAQRQPRLGSAMSTAKNGERSL